jgi:CspA family cold shock protein
VHLVHPGRQGRQSRSLTGGGDDVQGVIKSYDPGTKVGVVISDADLAEFDLSEEALTGSIFRTLRQGQRVVFDLDGSGRASSVRMGSEVDLGTPDYLEER